MTIVKFTQHSGYTYYYTDWDGDMSGEYVPLAEYLELLNLINELGEKDVQNRLLIGKLKALIQRAIDIKPNLGGHYAWQNEELIQLLKDCKQEVA